jgi:hypothetical protein
MAVLTGLKQRQRRLLAFLGLSLNCPMQDRPGSVRVLDDSRCAVDVVDAEPERQWEQCALVVSQLLKRDPPFSSIPCVTA